MLLNNDINLISSLKNIQIPIISKEDFVRMFREFCEDYYCIGNSQDFEQKFLTNTGQVDITGEVFDDMELANHIDLDCGYVYVLPDEVPGRDIVNIIGLRQTSKGIPYLGYISAEDSNMEVFRVVFFDGNNFQIYTPYYGNCWNTDFGWVIGYEGGNEDEDEDFCSKYGTDLDTVVNASRTELIDENAIITEIETVFCAGIQIQNPILQKGNNSSMYTGTNTVTNSNANTTSSTPKKTEMAILYDIFNKKMLSMILPLQQALTSQGMTVYDKDNCFKNIQDKDTFKKDIYNYILQFNLFDSSTNQMIECTKIAMYIKRFQYHHERLVL